MRISDWSSDVCSSDLDDPQWAGREFMTPDEPDDPASPVTIRREGMAAFFQGKDSDRDDCEFCGPVKAVRELEGDAFGQRAWVLTVTVMRDQIGRAHV